MAGLGAGAGAFEGDNERAAQAARSRGLGLQAARLREDARQFDANLKRQDREAQRWQANQDRVFEAGREDAAFNREQTEFQNRQTEFQNRQTAEKDAWQAALDDQNLRIRERDMEMMSAKFDNWKLLADEEKEKMRQQKLLAQTAAASAMAFALNNGGVGPASFLPELSGSMGADVRGYYIDQTGQFIMDVAVRDENGQERIVQNPFPPAAQAGMMQLLEEMGRIGKGSAETFRQDMASEKKHKRDMERDTKRYDSYLERAGQQQEGSAKPQLGAAAKAELGILEKQLKGAYEDMHYAETDGEREEARESIGRIRAQMDAIESGGGTAGSGGAQPQGRGGAGQWNEDIMRRARQIKDEVEGKYGKGSPRARREYERLMRRGR